MLYVQAEWLHQNQVYRLASIGIPITKIRRPAAVLYL